MGGHCVSDLRIVLAEYDKFLPRFKMLAPETWPHWRVSNRQWTVCASLLLYSAAWQGDARAGCLKIMEHMGLTDPKLQQVRSYIDLTHIRTLHIC